MALISLQNINIAFGGLNILENLNLQIEKNQRICLLGRNGTGKSTLMKIISGKLIPDSGILRKDQGVRISYFAQDIPDNLDGSVFRIIAESLGIRGELLVRYHDMQTDTIRDDAHNESIRELHDLMEEHQVWSANDEIKTITSRMGLDPDWDYQSLSGGQKRRVLLAAALVSNPDILLLDEPTNHMDIDSIAWLEEYLLRTAATILFVTHDRMLLRRLANRIIELDRGSLTDWTCDYDTFLNRKQALLEAEEKEWERFDKKLAEEEVWIRRGIRARRTRNEGRVRVLKKMREERKLRRTRDGNVSMKISEEERSGKIVIETEGVSFSYDDKPLIENFNSLISRGDKIGIVGSNGCGKTTLINLLLGKIRPKTGTIKQGSNLTFAYYDQLRRQLDEEKSVWENVLSNGNMVVINDKSKHIISYLQDFLFTPDRIKSPVSQLSGGERNRLLLAKLFTNPANLLVLDEPTNDLDAETLELLEELLVDFSGTVLLISHDRAFLNNVVTSIFAFTGPGKIEEYIGGYDDWLLQKQLGAELAKSSKPDKKIAWKEEKKARQKVKLTYREKQELETLPEIIETLEHRQNEIHTKMADPEFYRMKEEISILKDELEEVEYELTKVYKRWEYLESFGN